jgi:uncharacterized membrane protein
VSIIGRSVGVHGTPIVTDACKSSAAAAPSTVAAEATASHEWRPRSGPEGQDDRPSAPTRTSASRIAATTSVVEAAGRSIRTVPDSVSIGL